MKYTRTAIGLLTAQYRSVLKKCWLINVGLFALGAAAVVPSEAQADAYNRYSAQMRIAQTGSGDGSPGWIANESYIADGWRLADNLDSQFHDRYWEDDYTTAVFVHQKRPGEKSATVYDSNDPLASEDTEIDYFVMGNFVGDVYYSLNWLKSSLESINIPSLTGYATEAWVNSNFLKTAPSPNNPTITISIRGTSDSFTLDQSSAKTLTFNDVALISDVTAEETRAKGAESTLQTNINTEATNRATAVSNEATARANADDAILNGTSNHTSIKIGNNNATAIDQGNKFYAASDGNTSTLATTRTVAASISNLLNHSGGNTWSTLNTFNNGVDINGGLSVGQGNLYVDGLATVTGNVRLSGTTNLLDGNLTVDGTTALKATTVTGAFTNTGNTSISGTASVGGQSYFKDSVHVRNGTATTDNVTITASNGNIWSKGAISADGAISAGTSISSGTTASVGTNLTVGGTSTVTGQSYFKNNLHVQNGTTDKMTVTASTGRIWTANDVAADGSISAGGNATITGNTTVNGNTTLGDAQNSDTLTVNAKTYINGDVTEIGNASTDKLTVNAGSTFKNTIQVNNGNTKMAEIAYDTGNISTKGTLKVDGNTTLGDNAAADTLTVNAKSTFNNDVGVNGKISATSDLSVGGNATITGNTTVNGDTKLGDTRGDKVEIWGDTTVNNNVTFKNGEATKATIAYATGDITTEGNLLVKGNTTLGNDQASDTLTVNAKTYLYGNENVIGDVLTDILTVNANTIHKNNIRMDDSKTFTMYAGNNTTPQIQLNGANGDIKVYDSGGHAPVAMMNRVNDENGRLTLSRYNGSGTSTTPMVNLQSTADGSSITMNNTNGKKGITLLNSGSTPQSEFTMYAGGSTTVEPTSMIELKAASGTGGTLKLTDGTSLKNEQTKSSITLTNSSNNQAVNILTETDGTGTIITKNAAGDPVNTINKDGITIANSKQLYMGTTDYALDTYANLRNTIVLNGRLMDTFSLGDNLYDGNSNYGDINTIASTKTVANALGNLRELGTNYLFDTEFGRDGNTVAENLKRIDSKIDTWTNRYDNITTSTKVTDASDSAGSFVATPTIGDTFEAIDKAIGKVAAGSYVGPYNGTDGTSIAGNINKLDIQLATTYSGMLTNRTNLNTLRSEVGYRNNLDLANKNLTYGSSAEPANIVSALNNMSYTVGLIHNLANSNGTVNTTDTTSTVGNRTNLNYRSKTVSGQLVALDNAIDKAKTRITNTETAIGTIANLSTGNYVATAGDLTTAVLTLDGQIKTNANRIGNLGSLTGRVAGKSNLVAAANTLDTAITAEETRAKAAESTLTTAVNTEKTRATTAENNLSTAISNEVARARGVEGNLNNLRVEIPEGLDTNLVNAINALKGTVDDLDTEISSVGTDIGSLSDLTHRAISDRSKITKAVNSLATNVGTGMGGSFNANGRWSGTATTYLGSQTVYNLMDAVQHVSNAIGTVADFGETPANGLSVSKTVNQNLTALSESLTAEQRRASREEATLNGKITDETTRATEAETNLNTLISNETTRARGVEGSLANLTGHATGSANLVAAINAVDQEIYTEKDRALGAEATLRTNLTAEAARATAAEETNATAISNEVTRATQAETNLGNSINSLNLTVGGLNSINQNAVSDRSTVTKAINSLASNVSGGMGGSFSSDGVWTGNIQTYKDTNPVSYHKITDMVGHVSDTIGTVADLGYVGGAIPKNGVNKNNTVNANIAALNKAIGDAGVFKSSSYSSTNLAKDATDVVDAITKIDNYVSSMGNVTGDLSALTHPAITVSQRTKITNAVNSLATNVADGMGGTFTEGSGKWSGSIQTYRDTTAKTVNSIMDAVDHVNKTIGTDADLGYVGGATPKNGVSKSNTVNANIGAINNKLGDISTFSADAYSGAAKNAVSAAAAISAIDTALSQEISRATVKEGELQDDIDAVDARVDGVSTNLSNLTTKVSNIGADLGGTMTDAGTWTGAIKTYKDSADVEYHNVLDTVKHVSNVIGSAADLGTAANGVSATQTVNKNIGALSSALTNEITRSTSRENAIDTKLEDEISRATAKETTLTNSINTVSGNVTNLSNNLSTLTTKVDNIGTGLGGTLSDEGEWSGSIQTYKDTSPKAVTTIMGAVNHVVSVLGTAAELGTENGVSATQTVNKNIGALSSALTDEIDRATAKEGVLQSSINTVSGNVTTISNNVSNLTTKVNNIGTSLGGTLSDTGEWTGSLKMYKDSAAIEYDNMFDSIKHVSDVIGTAAELGTANGVSATQTVNKNIGALSTALTNAITDSIARDETLGDNIDVVDGKITTLNTTVTELGDSFTTLNNTVTDLGDSYNTLNTTVNNLSGWVGTGPFTHAAISDKSSVTGAVNSLATNVANGMGGTFNATTGAWSTNIIDNRPVSYGQISGATAITTVLSQVVSNIGKASDLGTGTLKNGLSASNSVNANLAGLSTAMGDVSRFKAADYQGTSAKNAASLEAAIESVDKAVKDLVISSGGGAEYAIELIHAEEARAEGVENGLRDDLDSLSGKVGDLSGLTNKAITQRDTLVNAINSAADSIEAATGGTFQDDGSWKGSIQTYKDAAAKDVTTIMGAVEHVAGVIGSVEDLGYDDSDPEHPIVPANGVSKDNTVNKNIAALNTAIENVKEGYATKEEVHGVDGTSGDSVTLGEFADTTTIGTATTGIKVDTTSAATGNKVEIAANTIKLGDSVTVNNTNGLTTFGTGDNTVKIQNGALEAKGNVTAGGLVLTNNSATPVTKVDGGTAAISSGAADTMATTATIAATVGNVAGLNTINFAGSGDTVADKLSVLNSKIGKVADIAVDMGTSEKNVVNAINKINTMATSAGTDISHIKAALGDTFDETTGVWGDTVQTYKDTNPVAVTDVMSAVDHVVNVIGTAAELGSANGVSATKTVNANIGALSSELTNVKNDLTGNYVTKEEVHGDPNDVDTIQLGESADKIEIGSATTGIKLNDTTGNKRIEVIANTIKIGDQITVSKTDASTSFSGNVNVAGKTVLSDENGLSFGESDIVAKNIVNSISGSGSAESLVTSKAVADYVGKGNLTLKINGENKTAFSANASNNLLIDLGSYLTLDDADTDHEIKTNGNVTIIEDSTNVGANLTSMANVVKSNADAIAGAVDTADKITIKTGGEYMNDGKLITSGAVRNYVEGIDAGVVHLTGPEDITGTKTFKTVQVFEKTISSGTEAGTYTTNIDGKTLTMKKGADASITLDGNGGNASFGGTLAAGGLATLSGGALVANGQTLNVGAAGGSDAKFNLNGSQEVASIVNEVTSTDDDVLKSQLVTAKAVKNVVDSIAVATGDRVIVSDSNNKMVSSDITTTQLNQLSDINTNKTIQTQLNEKMNTADWTTTVSETTYLDGTKIAAGSVDSSQLATDSVTTIKIADGNVTKDKLDDDVQASLTNADNALQNVMINGVAQTKTDKAVNLAVVVNGSDVEVTPDEGQSYTNDGKLISSGAVREYVNTKASGLVKVAGDTMTGALIINNGSATEESLATSGYISTAGGVKFNGESQVMKGTYAGNLGLGTEGDGGNNYTLVTTKSLASTVYNQAQNGVYAFGTGTDKYITSDTDTTIGEAITSLNKGLKSVKNGALENVMVNGETLGKTNQTVDIRIEEGSTSGAISVNGGTVYVHNAVNTDKAQDITGTKTFKAPQKFTKTEEVVIEDVPTLVTYETDIDGKTLKIGKVGDPTITLNGNDGSSMFDGAMQVDGGIRTTTLNTTGAITSSGLITANAGVNTTTLTASDVITANKGLLIKDGEKLTLNGANLTTVLKGENTALTDDDNTIATSRVIQNAITNATNDMATMAWVLGNTGAQKANFEATGEATENVLVGTTRNIGEAINYLGKQVYTINGKFGTDADLGYNDDPLHPVIPANGVSRSNSVNANIAALNTAIGDVSAIEVNVEGDKDVVKAINKINSDLQSATGGMSVYALKTEVHGDPDAAVNTVTIGDVADRTIIGNAATGITVDTTDAGKKIDVVADTINLGDNVTISKTDASAVFGSGDNTVQIKNGAVEAKGNVTTGGLVLKNGSGSSAYTSQTITRIDADSETPLTTGSATTLATTQTVARTVGNVAGLTTGNFANSGDTVAEKLSRLNDVIGDFSVLGTNASNGISDKNKLTNAIASLATNVTVGMGGSFDSTSGVWKGNVQTYKDPAAVEVSSIMGAVDHLSDVFGTAAELGYDDSDPEHPITPKNNLSKSNTVNANLAALNTALGDASDFGNGAAKTATNAVDAIKLVDTALGQEIIRAQKAEGNIDNIDPDLGLTGDNKNLVNAINKVNETVKAINGDYVTQEEIHGDNDTTTVDTITFGDKADNTVIGTEATNITVDTTTGGNKVDITAGKINLGSKVSIDNASGLTTFGTGTDTVKVQNGAVEAKGNVTAGGLILTNNTTAVSKVDLGTAPVTAGATDTMATTATVYATVGNVAGLNSGNFEGSGNTVEAKLSALNDAVGDVSDLVDGNFTGSGDKVEDKLSALDDAIGNKSALGTDASNGISDKSDVTNAIASLATNVGAGLGGSFNGTTGAWSGSVQTYKDATAVPVSSVMGAVGHISNTIGSVVDLGYDDETTPTVTPKNGVSKSNTVNANIAAVNAAVGDTSALDVTWGTGEDHNVVNAVNKVKNLVTTAGENIDDIKTGMGGSFDETSGAWSATASTYKSTITVNNLMAAVNHVSDTIGTAVDLGYDNETAPTVTPKNGISKSNSVNANIAALNTAIGDMSALSVDLDTGVEKNLVNAVNKVNSLVGSANTNISNIQNSFGGDGFSNGQWTATISTYKGSTTVHTVADAVGVVSDTLGTANQLTSGTQNTLSASNTVNQNLRALDNAITEAKQSISDDYVSKKELHGDNDASTVDTVLVGDQAARSVIGTVNTGIIVDTTTGTGGNRIDIAANNINLGTTVEVNNQDHSVMFRGDNGSVEIKDGNVAASSVEIGGKVIDSIDTGTAITTANASTTTLATTATVANTMSAAMGGQFDPATGKWKTTASTYLSTIEVDSFIKAVDHVSDTIGTAAQLGTAMNGVSATKTVNSNIAAVNSTIGDLKGLAKDLGNLTNGREYDPDNVVEVLNNLDSTIGRIHGLVNTDGTVNSSRIKSTVGKGTNLAQGDAIEDYFVTLDNAIGNRAYTSTNIVAKNSSAAEAISALDKSIGSAADLGKNPINGVKAGNSVNANITAVNTALGDISKLKDTHLLSDAVSMTDAVKSLDAQIYGMATAVNDVAYQLNDMKKEMRGGFASAAALSALVPNARSEGKTSLSLGMGGYKGTSAVAVGGFHYITDNLLVNAGASMGQDSEALYRVGMTYSF